MPIINKKGLCLGLFIVFSAWLISCSGSEREINFFNPYGDLDGDGILNDRDLDLDGDGVANFLDEFPHLKNRRGRDRNHNAIPDFLDFTYRAQRSPLELAIQVRLFDEFGILVTDFPGDEFTINELLALNSLFSSAWLGLKKSWPTLKVIVKRGKNRGVNGRYLADSQRIELFSPPPKAVPYHFLATALHEVFHALAYEFGGLFDEFRNVASSGSKPTLPSALAAKDVHELFSECAMASYLWAKGEALGPLSVRFSNLAGYFKSFGHADLVSRVLPQMGL